MQYKNPYSFGNEVAKQERAKLEENQQANLEFPI